MAGKLKQHRRHSRAGGLGGSQGDRTVNELASQFGGPPTLIRDWKKQLLDGADQVFGHGGTKVVTASAEAEKAGCSSRSVGAQDGTGVAQKKSEQLAWAAAGPTPASG